MSLQLCKLLYLVLGSSQTFTKEMNETVLEANIRWLLVSAPLLQAVIPLAT